jgi:hypothetical protein
VLSAAAPWRVDIFQDGVGKYGNKLEPDLSYHLHLRKWQNGSESSEENRVSVAYQNVRILPVRIVHRNYLVTRD